MKSELTDEFIQCFSALPGIVKETARKTYKLWKQNPFHPITETTIAVFRLERDKSAEIW
jgi:hypothetical protein